MLRSGCNFSEMEFMKLPEKYRRVILSEIAPELIYRTCLEESAKDGIEWDYAVTETIVYATEVRCAIQVLQNGRPDSWWNFADLTGDAHTRLRSILDTINPLRIAFVGSGPYPVTAFQLREQYPSAKITCIDNNIVAHLLSEMIIAKLDLDITTCFVDAIDVNYEAFGAVIIAAMVRGKRDLIEKILHTSNALVMARGQIGIRHERLIEVNSQFRDDGSLGCSVRTSQL